MHEQQPFKFAFSEFLSWVGIGEIKCKNIAEKIDENKKKKKLKKGLNDNVFLLFRIHYGIAVKYCGASVYLYVMVWCALHVSIKAWKFAFN